jgi:hypothetical protein
MCTRSAAGWCSVVPCVQWTSCLWCWAARGLASTKGRGKEGRGGEPPCVRQRRASAGAWLRRRPARRPSGSLPGSDQIWQAQQDEVTWTWVQRRRCEQLGALEPGWGGRRHSRATEAADSFGSRRTEWRLRNSFPTEVAGESCGIGRASRLGDDYLGKAATHDRTFLFLRSLKGAGRQPRPKRAGAAINALRGVVSYGRSPDQHKIHVKRLRGGRRLRDFRKFPSFHDWGEEVDYGEVPPAMTGCIGRTRRQSHGVSRKVRRSFVAPKRCLIFSLFRCERLTRCFV